MGSVGGVESGVQGWPEKPGRFVSHPSRVVGGFLRSLVFRSQSSISKNNSLNLSSST